ncbi:MAG: DUF3010 family protein [Deltaproteobacteria bacterium]|nr:DUF3010 family protein [Deltaproteobacteria bacterium]
MAAGGIFLKGNFAHIVTLDGTKNDHKMIDEKFDKIEMVKNPSQKDVAKICDTIARYIKKNDITILTVNRRITAGQMAGAAGTFLWEGVLLATSPVPLNFVHAATLRSTVKKFGDLKKTFPEENVLQSKAYDFAFEGLK